MILLSPNNDQLADALLVQKQAKIKTFKHKLYVLVLVIILFLIYPLFSSIVSTARGNNVFAAITAYPGNFFEGIYKASDGGIRGQLQDIQQQIDLQTINLQESEKDQKTITFLQQENNRVLVKRCIEQQQCNGFSETLKNNLPLLRTYLVLSSYTGTKMSYDQKSLLNNITTSLLKQDDDSTIAILENVTFSQPLIVNEKEGIYKVPFVMSLQFENAIQLILFIKNVEKKLYKNSGIVYRIGAMNYDIAKFSQNQKVDITLYAYFYK